LPAFWRSPADVSRTAWSAKSCRRFSRLSGARRSSGPIKHSTQNSHFEGRRWSLRLRVSVSLSLRFTRMLTKASLNRVVRSRCRGQRQAGLSAGSSPLERWRRPAKLCERAIPAVALQAVSGRRKRASGVGRKTRSPPTQSAISGSRLERIRNNDRTNGMRRPGRPERAYRQSPQTQLVNNSD